MDNIIVAFFKWLLRLFGAKPLPTPIPPATGDLSKELVAKITELARNSPVARLSWRDRGVAPVGYVEGMAVAFAVVLRKFRAGDSAAQIMARAVVETVENDKTDALSWYNSNFHAIGMDNDTTGVDTLRHLYVMLTGLGMRESSGRYCEGRDRSATNTTADTAESGLFQMSWDIHGASPEFSRLKNIYAAGAPGYMSVFQSGVHPTPQDLEIAGSGDGAVCQKLCKDAPLFAVETAAVGLRTRGGNVGHWGPIRRKDVEIRTEVDTLYKQIQTLVDGGTVVVPKPVTPPVVVQTQWPKESVPGALEAFYGDPRGPNGEASPEWIASNMVKIVSPYPMKFEGEKVSSIFIHRKVASSLNRILLKIWDLHDHDMNKIHAAHLDEFDGSFNFRLNRNNPNKLSLHAFGAAIDIAAAENPNGKAWEPGMIPLSVVRIFLEAGWSWGGSFSGTKDCQHFQATFNVHKNEPLPDEHGV